MKETYTREEAAAALGCSLRTLDRWIPPGTPGRTDRSPAPGKPAGVYIDHALVKQLLPAPGGDDNAA